MSLWVSVTGTMLTVRAGSEMSGRPATCTESVGSVGTRVLHLSSQSKRCKRHWRSKRAWAARGAASQPPAYRLTSKGIPRMLRQAS